MLVYLIPPPFPLTCHLLTRCKVLWLKGAFDASLKVQPASPGGSGWGKRAAVRAAAFCPGAHLPDMRGPRAASRFTGSLLRCRRGRPGRTSASWMPSRSFISSASDFRKVCSVTGDSSYDFKKSSLVQEDTSVDTEIKILTVMGSQGEDKLAFNQVLIREEVLLMDAREVFEGRPSFLRTTTAASKPLRNT